ncbi:MAG: hypothetical protein GKR89_06795 [Candidatus Latescibacteria bacterium]|nr:hypothetical protein [Candidatus Latescibacterota bacterium]
MSLHRLFIASAVACLISAPLAAQEGDGWTLWSDKSQMPPDELMFGLPIQPSGENINTESAETPDSPFDIDMEEVIEQDGQAYKALQWTRDAHFEATVPANTYLIGLVGNFYPNDTADPVENIKAMNLVSVEIDGVEVPIDDSYLLRREEFPFEGFVLGLYNVFPLFTTPGTHTYVQTFQQTDNYFMTVPFEELNAALGAEDPSPQFEGRRVYVPERIGDSVDGQIVFSYTLTVEEAPTAVEASSWAKIKQTFAE